MDLKSWGLSKRGGSVGSQSRVMAIAVQFRDPVHRRSDYSGDRNEKDWPFEARG
jgi:hypothetical protein